MGFFKKFSLKRAAKSYFGSGGFMVPGIAEATMFSDKFKNAYEDVGKGLENTLSGGMVAQNKATEEAKKARDQAAKQYQAEQAAAEATARKIAEAEEERKRRLALAGTQMPSTLVNSYLGVSGPASVRSGVLG